MTTMPFLLPVLFWARGIGDRGIGVKASARNQGWFTLYPVTHPTEAG